MRTFFASAVGLALTVVVASAQQQNVPPARVTTPPAIPDSTPARPRLGVVTGATGGIGLSPFRDPPRGIAGGVPTNATGRSAFTPFPVLVDPDTDFGPEFLDPLAAEGQFFAPLDVPANTGTAQGRPGGLGVTITGGSTNPPATPTNSTGR